MKDTSIYGKGHQAYKNLVQQKKDEIDYFIGEHLEVFREYKRLSDELSELQIGAHNAMMNGVQAITEKHPAKKKP